MKGRGYRYASPDSARTAMAERYKQSGVTPLLKSEEIAVAVADGQCAAQSDLPHVLLLIRRGLAMRMSHRDAALLSALERSRSAALARAVRCPCARPASRAVAR